MRITLRPILPVVIAVFAMMLSAFSLPVRWEEFTLKNGLRVLVIENKRLPIVTHMLVYKAGAIDEHYGKTGVAHFLEHMMFKTVTETSAPEYMSELYKVGGENNAFTTEDYTAYFFTVATEHLERFMKYEASRMKSIAFGEEEFSAEKNVILEERNLVVERKPLSRLIEHVRAALYLDHPYATPVIGWEADIKNITSADIQDFHQRYYRPANATLILSGDITVQKAKELAELYYANIPSPEFPSLYINRENPNSPVSSSERYVILHDNNVTEGEWLRLYLGPKKESKNISAAFATLVLAQIIGGSESSRLYESLVVKEGLATQISTQYEEFTLKDSALMIYALPKSGVKLATLDERIDAVLAEVAAQGITEKELEFAKLSLKHQAIYALETSQTIATIYAKAIASELEPSVIASWPELVENVTVEQVNTMAKEILKKDRSATGLLKPNTLQKSGR